MGVEALGKQAFLNLLTTQLQFQDPLKPMESTEFVAQLAQFRALESGLETNKKLDTLVERSVLMNRLNAAELLGRSVEVSGGAVSHQANQPDQIVYRLNADAEEVVIHITDGSGSVVRTLTMKGFQNKGTHKVEWDGRNNNGIAVPPGDYRFVGASLDSARRSVPIEIMTKGEVSNISYEDGKVIATVNGNDVPLEEIHSVSR
jgi:flagellar basal-body rod modification protein FlgD